MSEYVSHWVSLWKGRMDSQGAGLPPPWAFGNGENVGELGEEGG